MWKQSRLTEMQESSYYQEATLKCCVSYKEKILAKYNIDITSDEITRHPPLMCHLCYANLHLPKHHHLPNDWLAHPATGPCLVCIKVVSSNRGGRPQKTKYNRLMDLDNEEEQAKTSVEANFEKLTLRKVNSYNN